MTNTQVKLSLGSQVRHLRESAGINQVTLAAKMGVTSAYVSALEAGNKNPTLETICSLANALDIGLSQLFITSDRGFKRSPLEVPANLTKAKIIADVSKSMLKISKERAYYIHLFLRILMAPSD